jgi:hypothetical protein
MRNQDRIWQVFARRSSFLDTFFYAIARINEEVKALVEH